MGVFALDGLYDFHRTQNSTDEREYGRTTLSERKEIWGLDVEGGKGREEMRVRRVGGTRRMVFGC